MWLLFFSCNCQDGSNIVEVWPINSSHAGTRWIASNSSEDYIVILHTSGVILTWLSPHNFYQFLQLFNSNISTCHLRYLSVCGEVILRHYKFWRHFLGFPLWLWTRIQPQSLHGAIKLALSASGCRTRIRICMQVNNNTDNYRKRFLLYSYPYLYPCVCEHSFYIISEIRMASPRPSILLCLDYGLCCLTFLIGSFLSDTYQQKT